MSRAHYLLSYLVWRLLILWIEVGLPIGFGALVFGVPVRGRLVDLAVHLRVRVAVVQRARPADRAAGPGPSRRCRA